MQSGGRSSRTGLRESGDVESGESAWIPLLAPAAALRFWLGGVAFDHEALLVVARDGGGRGGGGR
eukprot:5846333-Pleurochrysis_carterae.AAC.1